jgi:DNA-binding NtrC family response regulator
MSAAQAQRSRAAARRAAMWVLNCDAHLRQVVEKAIQDYPLDLSLRLTLSEDFRPAAAAPSPDIVLVNLPEGTESCLSILPKIQQQWPDAHVIFLSQSDDIHLWAEAIQLGAYEFLPRSVEYHQLRWVLQGALWTGRKRAFKPSAPSI